jgi:hypothetical protein
MLSLLRMTDTGLGDNVFKTNNLTNEVTRRCSPVQQVSQSGGEAMTAGGCPQRESECIFAGE